MMEYSGIIINILWRHGLREEMANEEKSSDNVIYFNYRYYGVGW